MQYKDHKQLVQTHNVVKWGRYVNISLHFQDTLL